MIYQQIKGITETLHQQNVVCSLKSAFEKELEKLPFFIFPKNKE